MTKATYLFAPLLLAVAVSAQAPAGSGTTTALSTTASTTTTGTGTSTSTIQSSPAAQTPATSQFNNNIFSTAQNSLQTMRHFAQAKPAFGGVSASCQEAINGQDISPECVRDTEVNPTDNDFAKMCNAPTNGNGDRRCSPDQVNRALDTLESRCGKELNEKNAEVLNYYTRWQTYTLNYDIICSKTSSGAYCLTGAQPNANDAQCVRDQVGRIQAWKPPRQDKYVQDSASTLRAAAADAAKQNNIPTSQTTATPTKGANSKSSASSFTAAHAGSVFSTAAGVIAAAMAVALL
ncbi:hypothetical protein THASP1DRAFT_23009 [Thamnocephalis sphaerospora]|uniref:Secreted protein n=1 Tax=Thamnocephalis sphaerospora TaxID=78915 RepID=A0A4P9XSJ6_9FUNG|nr:hypothetical protein THASP1DRAFT_23009 [Thamnocephalis sphaerospora]|eukprot:RKP09105.1 hypothetical protein THASP1DRAFT_23009 [Thamnocephalis sphaerospora]